MLRLKGLNFLGNEVFLLQSTQETSTSNTNNNVNFNSTNSSTTSSSNNTNNSVSQSQPLGNEIQDLIMHHQNHTGSSTGGL